MNMDNKTSKLNEPIICRCGNNSFYLHLGKDIDYPQILDMAMVCTKCEEQQACVGQARR